MGLSKAYDRVWRTGLWKRLWDEGIRGKMWRVIKKMYEGTRNCVIVGEEKTEFFEVEVGVRQGCVLSPILFSIYINGMAKAVKEGGKGIQVGRKNMTILLYADDVVLIADSRYELQKSMTIATEKKTYTLWLLGKKKTWIFFKKKNKAEIGRVGKV